MKKILVFLLIAAILCGAFFGVRHFQQKRLITQWNTELDCSVFLGQAYVDTAMADSGRLYSGLSSETVGMMRELCSMADVSTPNLSEYALITGEEYSLSSRRDDEIEEMLMKFPGKAVVIKGVPVKGGFVNACRDFSGSVSLLPIDMLKQNYPGTGDIFAAVLFAGLMNGRALSQSVRSASDFVRRAIEISMRSGGDIRHGVRIEAALGLLSEDK